jgi:hypothetical protein
VRADFAAEYQAMKGILEMIRGNLEPARNIVDLIWTIHGKGSTLVCEQCWAGSQQCL